MRHQGGKKDLSRLSVGKRQKSTEVDRALLASRHSTLHTRFNVLTGSRSGKAGTMKTPGRTRRDGTLTLTLIKLTSVCTYNKPNVGNATRHGLYHHPCHPLGRPCPHITKWPGLSQTTRQHRQSLPTAGAADMAPGPKLAPTLVYF